MPRPRRWESSSSFYHPIKQGLIFFVLALTLLLGMSAVYSARWILLVFLIGIGLGVVVSPAFEILHRKLNIPRVFSAMIFLTVLATLLGTLVIGFYQLLSEHIVPLLERLPIYLERAQEVLLDWSREWPSVQQAIQNIKLGDFLSRPFSLVLKSLQLSGTVIFGLLFAISVSVYFAVGSSRYRKGFLSLFPAHRRPRVSSLLSEVGQGVATAIAMWLIGLDNWFVYGLITGVLEIVPYFGPFVSAAVIGVVTLVTQPHLILWVLLAFLLIQQLENYILIPIIMKKQVDLPPVYLLVLLLLMGQWFGVIGVLIAPAVLAVSRAVLLKTYVKSMNEKRRASF